jgi:hypothetical protein
MQALSARGAPQWGCVSPKLRTFGGMHLTSRAESPRPVAVNAAANRIKPSAQRCEGVVSPCADDTHAAAHAHRVLLNKGVGRQSWRPPIGLFFL